MYVLMVAACMCVRAAGTELVRDSAVSAIERTERIWAYLRQCLAVKAPPFRFRECETHSRDFGPPNAQRETRPLAYFMLDVNAVSRIDG